MDIDLKNFKQKIATEKASASLVIKNLPFVLFITFLLVMYIASAHSAEKKLRQIQNAQKEVKTLRWEYMSLQSDYMQQTKRSEIVRVASDINLSVPRHQIKKIIIPKK